MSQRPPQFLQTSTGNSKSPSMRASGSGADRSGSTQTRGMLGSTFQSVLAMTDKLSAGKRS